MAVFPVPETSCPANVETVSPATVYNGGAASAAIALTSSEWDAKAGTGTLVWGLQRSDDGGLTYYRWFTMPGVGGEPLTIGQRFGKSASQMPEMRFSGADVIPATGARLRLFVVPTVAIRLGATITVT